MTRTPTRAQRDADLHTERVRAGGEMWERAAAARAKETTVPTSRDKKREKWAGDYIIVAKVIDIQF